VATRSLSNSSNRNSAAERGASSLVVLILLVPVILGMIGFAIDLGRLYSSRNELKTAANAMAIAAASQLIGTDASTGNATAFGNYTVDNSGFGNKYDFGGNLIGQTNGGESLLSTVSEPAYYQAVADAIADLDGSGATVAGAAAKYVRINIMGETPLVFWSFIPIAQNRRVAVQATAVAGISAPLCTACGIEPIAVAALDSTDTTNFGFIPQSLYTFNYLCTGVAPAVLPGGGPLVSYVLLNRLSTNTQVFAAETSQLLRMGAGGLPASTVPGDACFFINTAEQIWATATPAACNVTVNSSAQAFLCGVALRFSSSLQASCTVIPDSDTIATIYPQDPDLSTITDYTQYAGFGRRVITIPIVDSTADPNAMTVLGFRQFLVQPASNDVTIDAADVNGRFIVLYLGVVAPVKQGQIGGCSQSAGTGKVVPHR
jgi:Flp pilus assembly protein TadG